MWRIKCARKEILLWHVVNKYLLVVCGPSWEERQSERLTCTIFYFVDLKLFLIQVKFKIVHSNNLVVLKRHFLFSSFKISPSLLTAIIAVATAQKKRD